MSVLLLPVAPLSRTKSRLRDCFSKSDLKALSIAMFEDLAIKLSRVDCFDEKIVYCNDDSILQSAETHGLVGIKEPLSVPPKSFARVIQDLNDIAVENFGATMTTFIFLDLVLTSEENFFEVARLLKRNQVVICPAFHSAGISMFARNPPNVISSKCFSDPDLPSLFSLIREAEERAIKDIAIYDSFRAGFDVDVKKDLILAQEYLKMFGLTSSKTYQFLHDRLKLVLKRNSAHNNREFTIERKKENEK